MTKAKSKYELKDFFTKSISEKSTKMPLMMDKVDTGCYLLVKGINAKSVQRARVTAQVAYADLSEKLELIKDKTERIELEREEKESIEIDFAMALVDGWSFGEFTQEALLELLEENQGLAFGVIAHSTTTENYLAKK